MGWDFFLEQEQHFRQPSAPTDRFIDPLTAPRRIQQEEQNVSPIVEFLRGQRWHGAAYSLRRRFVNRGTVVRFHSMSLTASLDNCGGTGEITSALQYAL